MSAAFATCRSLRKLKHVQHLMECKRCRPAQVKAALARRPDACGRYSWPWRIW